MAQPQPVYLECILMANCEVLHNGQSMGFVTPHQRTQIQTLATPCARPHTQTATLREPPVLEDGWGDEETG